MSRKKSLCGAFYQGFVRKFIRMSASHADKCSTRMQWGLRMATQDNYLKNLSFRVSVDIHQQNILSIPPSIVSDYVNNYSLKMTQNKKKHSLAARMFAFRQILVACLLVFWQEFLRKLVRMSARRMRQDATQCGCCVHNAAKKQCTFYDRDSTYMFQSVIYYQNYAYVEGVEYNLIKY